MPYIQVQVSKTARTNKGIDEAELQSYLTEYLWRTVERCQPTEERRFSVLMFLELNQRTASYLKRIGRPKHRMLVSWDNLFSQTIVQQADPKQNPLQDICAKELEHLIRSAAEMPVDHLILDMLIDGQTNLAKLARELGYNNNYVQKRTEYLRGKIRRLLNGTG